MKIDPAEVFDLRAAGWTLDRLADRYHCTRAAVSYYLRRPRSRFNQERQPTPCACGCGRLHVVRRRTRQQKYATLACYFTHVRARVGSQTYVDWRHGQRIARRVVTEAGFPLKRQHVVHHVDHDTRHNDVTNLWVFASHATHMSFHRGGSGQPIWRGDALGS